MKKNIILILLSLLTLCQCSLDLDKSKGVKKKEFISDINNTVRDLDELGSDYLVYYSSENNQKMYLFLHDINKKLIKIEKFSSEKKYFGKEQIESVFYEHFYDLLKTMKIPNFYHIDKLYDQNENYRVIIFNYHNQKFSFKILNNHVIKSNGLDIYSEVFNYIELILARLEVGSGWIEE